MGELLGKVASITDKAVQGASGDSGGGFRGSAAAETGAAAKVDHKLKVANDRLDSFFKDPLEEIWAAFCCFGDDGEEDGSKNGPKKTKDSIIIVRVERKCLNSKTVVSSFLFSNPIVVVLEFPR